MNPSLEQIEKRLQALENVSNGNAYQKLVNTLIQSATDVANAEVEVDVTVSIGDGSDTIQVLDFPDRWLRVLYNGKTYRVPAYLESLDASR